MRRSCRTVVGDLAIEAVKEFPKSSNLQIARILRKKWPKVYRNVEHARSAVRTVRGARGKDHRKDYRVVIPRSQQDQERCRRLGALLPDPEPTRWKWHKLPPGPSKWLGIADLHIPYHCKEAVQKALEYGRKQGCDGLIVLGDLLDFYRLSTFCRDPRMRHVDDEIDAAEKFFDAVAKFLKPKEIVYKAGNHEDRVERYVMRLAPELPKLRKSGDTFSPFDFSSYFDFQQRNITYIPSQDFIQHGKLVLVHGHEAVKQSPISPVSPARTLTLKTRECTMAGHWHRTSQQPDSSIFGTSRRCWSVGCLCDLRPMYLPNNDWNHGLFILDLTGQQWRIENREIIKGEIL